MARRDGTLEARALGHRIGALPPVEEDEDTRLQAKPFEVSLELLEAALQRVGLAVAPDLQLQRLALRLGAW